MAEYIEREAALVICEKEYQERIRMSDWCGDTVAWNIGHEIKAIPSADVAPVRHGRWIDNKVAFYLGCSECGCYLEYAVDTFLDNGDHYHYCPNCGCAMDKEE